MGNPSQNKPDADERQRAARALELRTSGMAYAAIAAELNYSDESGPRRAVDRLLSRVECGGVEELRRLEGQRLDAMQRAIWPQACSGDLDAIRTALSIMGRRAKLLGLDAPSRVAVGPTVSDVEFANEAARLIESIGALVGTDGLMASVRIGAGQAVLDARNRMPATEGDDIGSQHELLSSAHSAETVADDYDGWSNIGGPDPEPAVPLAGAPQRQPAPEPQLVPDPQPVPQPVKSSPTFASHLSRRITDRYDPLAGWNR